MKKIILILVFLTVSMINSNNIVRFNFSLLNADKRYRKVEIMLKQGIATFILRSGSNYQINVSEELLKKKYQKKYSKYIEIVSKKNETEYLEYFTSDIEKDFFIYEFDIDEFYNPIDENLYIFGKFSYNDEPLKNASILLTNDSENIGISVNLSNNGEAIICITGNNTYLFKKWYLMSENRLIDYPIKQQILKHSINIYKETVLGLFPIKEKKHLKVFNKKEYSAKKIENNWFYFRKDLAKRLPDLFKKIAKGIDVFSNVYDFSFYMRSDYVLQKKNEIIFFLEDEYLEFFYIVADKNDESIFRVIMHESIEKEIFKNVFSNIYQRDKYSRWIGDGLAEFLTLRIFQKAYPSKKLFSKTYFWGVVQRIFYAVENKDIIVNLLDWEIPPSFTTPNKYISLPAMYNIALYFWYKLEEDYGKELIKDFLQKAKDLVEPTSEDVIKLLSDLTGETVEAIRDRLKINQKDVYNLISKI